MTEDSPPPPPPGRTFSPPKGPPRRSLTVDESAQYRHRPPNNRFSTSQDAPAQGIRRRSSNFSDYSLREARKSFQSSTDNLLLPKPSATGLEPKHESSNWDSAPLAFALLPALGGMVFTNGSSVITDVMLLGLAAIFLNWSVRLPWDWYHSAQEIRKKEEYNGDTLISEESEGDDALSFSQATLEEVPEDEQAEPAPKPVRRLPAHEAATNELYTHEMLALLSCFLFPLLGAYLLHTIRSQLSRPSEGLVSDYNLTIFLLASELRPMAHLVKLIQARTLHLQRIVNTNPYDTVSGQSTSPDVKDLTRRLEDLEARNSIAATPSTLEPTLNGKQSAIITTEVRRGLQPELDALNRAVRRYEKRATLQAFQTDSRLHELEARLNDAISLAAAAANTAQHKRGFTGVLIEWAATAVVLPVQAAGWLIGLPFRITASIFNYGKAKVKGKQAEKDKGRKVINGNGRASSKSRVQVRSGKRIAT
ncbi:uncharacterized protein LY89DRAFT_785374 [Mollisia scopiformis]|uniref:Uncharacterized protein n=1 Tax=Mollisia scopiformis TaxID=149040 RepID=A0A194WXU3_MOLSC|nr:uncharacterized protein LY89DRAFT_785374 [Mollisia scopiformis]KUJ12796.1 hypothetical protein LY89DRAFT_785374 [Mollisia scopiformis]